MAATRADYRSIGPAEANRVLKSPVRVSEVSYCFLKGLGLRLLWFDLLLLIVYAVGVSFLAVRKLRQKIA